MNPTLSPLDAAQITAGVIAIVGLVKWLIPEGPHNTMLTRDLSAALGAVLTVLTVMGASGFHNANDVVMAVFQGLSLGVAATVGVAGAKVAVTKLPTVSAAAPAVAPGINLQGVSGATIEGYHYVPPAAPAGTPAAVPVAQESFSQDQ